MVKVALSKRGVDNLAKFVDSVEIASLKTTKDIRVASNIVKDLVESIDDYLKMLGEHRDKQTAVFKKHRDLYLALPEEEKEDKKKESDQAMKEEMDALDISDLKAHQKMEIEFELGDDKHVKLKELFETYGTDKYQDKDAYLEVADALEV